MTLQACWLKLPIAARLLGAAACGAALGVAAWGSGRSPVLALLLPVLAVALPRSYEAFVLVAAYMLSSTRFLATGALTFADTRAEGAVLVLGWMCLAVATAALWAAPLALAAQRPWARVAAVVAAQAAMLLPPLWLLGLAHPVVATGYLLPGTQWIGVGVGLFVPSLLGLALARAELRAGALALTLVVLAGGQLASQEDPELIAHERVYAVSTSAGSSKSPDHDAAKWLPKFAAVVRILGRDPDQPVDTVFFPETALGYVNETVDRLVQWELQPALQETGITAVMGAVRRVEGRFRVSALVVTPTGSVRYLDARQPTPVALWAPWNPEETYEAGWNRDNLVITASGRRIWVSFCHEDVMPGLLLDAVAAHRPDTIVSIANNWWMSESGTQAQARSVEGVARLFGLKLLRAVNRSRAMQP